MASVDVPVALLGYGTVGSAINYFLTQNADDIERATGHRLRVVKALVRDVEKERDFNAAPGVLTTNFADILDDAAIPVIKVLRESLVVTNVHRVLGIVNGTTNFILSQMEAGKDYAEALADAQERGYAEADPTADVSGADAAAKMAILATVAFGSR